MTDKNINSAELLQKKEKILNIYTSKMSQFPYMRNNSWKQNLLSGGD